MYTFTHTFTHSPGRQKRGGRLDGMQSTAVVTGSTPGRASGAGGGAGKGRASSSSAAVDVNEDEGGYSLALPKEQGVSQVAYVCTFHYDHLKMVLAPCKRVP